MSFSGFANCTTDVNGQCRATKIGTAVGTFTTTATASGVTLGSLTYHYIVGPASAGNSAIAVTTDHQRADGTAADVLTATVRDASNNPLSGVPISFAATPGVNLGAGLGALLSCTTTAAGTCTANAVSTVAASYTTAVTMGSTPVALGNLRYDFVPGPVSGSQSGLRVVTDNAFADGTSQDLIEVLLRDAQGNPVTTPAVVNFSAAGADVSLNGAARGAVGSCTTATATGVCQVTATSSSFAGGARSSIVTVGGAALTGNITAGTLTYGPSPANFNFSAWIDASKSSISIVTDNQIINSTAPDVLQAILRNASNAPVPGIVVSFSGFANCTTDSTGQCQATKIGTVAGPFTTTATASGVSLGTLTYHYIVGPPSVGNSTIAVTTDHQRADGIAADVLTATLRDAFNNPIPGASISFAATPGVNLGAGLGTLLSCSTSTAGICTVNAVSTIAAAYSTVVATVGSPAVSLGTLRYDFVPGPVSLAQSGVRVVTDNVFADGTSQDVIEVLLRDAQGNPLTLPTLVDFAGAGADVSLNGAARGAGSNCTTLAATGACRVTATSSSFSGGAKSSNVTLAGTAPAGTFSVGSLAYGPSPARFTFAPWVPRLQIIKQVGSGSGVHAFRFNLTGLQSASDTLTVTAPGSAAGAALLGTMPARPITITEMATADWPEAPLSASCVDLAGATPTVTFGSLAGYQLTIPADRSVAGADLKCTFVNGHSSTVSGRLFTDNGAGGGIANDGIANGGEPGLPGAAVTLGDCAASAAGVYATTRTDAGGGYRLAVPPAVVAASPLCVFTPQVASRLASGASVAATALVAGSAVSVAGVGYTYSSDGGVDRVRFAWPGAAGSSLSGIDLGSVLQSSFGRSQVGTGMPGTTVDYHHLFTAGTSGTVVFSVTGTVPTPGASAWSQRIYADAGCTGKLQPGAATLFPPATTLPVTAGQIVCLILRESVPQLAAPESRQQTRVQAAFVFANARPALSATYLLEDVTTVSEQALALLKEVRNLGDATPVFGTNNTARPGQTLEYRVTYANNGATPIHHLRVHDATPAFTSFKSASAGSLPMALTGCSKLTPSGGAVAEDCSALQPVGGQGTIDWEFTGDLAPGAGGTVTFQVVVD